MAHSIEVAAVNIALDLTNFTGRIKCIEDCSVAFVHTAFYSFEGAAVDCQLSDSTGSSALDSLEIAVIYDHNSADGVVAYGI